MAAKLIELASLRSDGGWDLIGDFGSLDRALRAAEEYHASGDAHILDDGSSVFGISDDPDSGHYETFVGVWADSDAVVLS